MASHPIAKAIVGKAESLNLSIPSTRGQLTEPGFGCLAEVDGSLVAVGALEWVHQCFQIRITETALTDLEEYVIRLSSSGMSEINHSRSIVYVGHEGQGIIGAIVICDTLREDAQLTVGRYIWRVLFFCYI